MHTPHLLLVEDSELVVDAMRLLFEETGHRVTVARSVAGAIGACERERPDVMLLDLSLPDGDGLAAVAVLRHAGALPPVVVALTGHDDRATIERCLAAGCREVLLKPVPTREMLKKVAGWMGEIAARRAG